MPEPNPTDKKPDVDPLAALGNALNDLRKTVEDSGKKYDAAIADLSSKIPKPPEKTEAPKNCECPACKALGPL